MGGRGSKPARTIIADEWESPELTKTEEEKDEIQTAKDSLGIVSVEQNYPDAAPPISELPTIPEEDEDETLTIEDDSNTKSVLPSARPDSESVIPVQVGTSLQKSLIKKSTEGTFSNTGTIERFGSDVGSSVGDAVMTMSEISRPNSSMVAHHQSLVNITKKKKEQAALTQREALLLERESYEYRKLTGSSHSLNSTIPRGQVRNVSFREGHESEQYRMERKKEAMAITANEAAEMHKEHNAKSFKDVIMDLTSGFKSDAIKVKAILAWICKQSIGKIDFGNQKFNPNTPNGYMELMQDGNGTYPGLFALLCRAAEIKCVIINGASKGAGYEVGSETIGELQNTWNAVFIDDSWRLVHPLWVCKSLAGRRTKGWVTIESQGNAKHDVSNPNSGVVSYGYNDYFIFTKPEEFIYRHFPEDPKWQLLKDPISRESFLLKSYIRPAFFVNEFKLLSEDSCVFESQDAESVEIVIGFPEAVAHDVVFGYELNLKVREDSDEDANSVKNMESFGRYVLVSKSKDRVSFEARFAMTGTYKLRLFGGLHSEYGDSPPWIMDVKLICSLDVPKIDPLPFDPGVVGWGPSPIAERLGLYVPSHAESVLQLSFDEEAVVHFILKQRMVFDVSLRHFRIRPGVLEHLVKYEMVEMNDVVQLTVSIMSPIHGEYALKIDICNEDKQENACNYLLRTGKVKHRENFHQRKARKVLSEAMMTSDIQTLTHALKVCEESAVPLDDPEQLAAEKRLEYLHCKNELKTALLVRRIDRLETALYRVQQANLDRLFENEIKRVKRHLREIISLDKDGWNSRIPEIDRMSLMELSQLRQPKQPVRYVIMMMYLLLGVPQDFMTDWTQLKLLLRNKDATLVEMAKLESYLDMESVDITTIDESILERVEEVIQTYSEEDIRKIDNTAAAFYIWVRMVHRKLKQRQALRPAQQNQFASNKDLNAIKSPNPRKTAVPRKTAGIRRHNSVTSNMADQKNADILRSKSVKLGHNDSGYPKETLGGDSLLSGRVSIARTEGTPLGKARVTNTAVGNRHAPTALDTTRNIATGGKAIPTDVANGSRPVKHVNQENDATSLLHFSPIGNRLSAITRRQTPRPTTRVPAKDRNTPLLSGQNTSTPNQQPGTSAVRRISNTKITDAENITSIRNDSFTDTGYSRHNTATGQRPSHVSRTASRLSVGTNDILGETQNQQAGRKSALVKDGTPLQTKSNGTESILGIHGASSRKNSIRDNRPPSVASGKYVISRPGSTAKISKVTSSPIAVPSTVTHTNEIQNGRLQTAIWRRGARHSSLIKPKADRPDIHSSQDTILTLADDLQARKDSSVSKTNKHQTFVKNTK